MGHVHVLISWMLSWEIYPNIPVVHQLIAYGCFPITSPIWTSNMTVFTVHLGIVWMDVQNSCLSDLSQDIRTKIHVLVSVCTIPFVYIGKYHMRRHSSYTEWAVAVLLSIPCPYRSLEEGGPCLFSVSQDNRPRALPVCYEMMQPWNNAGICIILWLHYFMPLAMK